VNYQKLFSSKKLTLVDAKFEFGFYNGEIYLADEISGDTIRVIDDQSRHLDKEVSGGLKASMNY